MSKQIVINNPIFFESLFVAGEDAKEWFYKRCDELEMTPGELIGDIIYSSYKAAIKNDAAADADD